MKTRTVFLAFLCIIVLLVLSFSPLSPRPAAAHIVKGFGDYLVEVGWNNEPALTSQMNAVQVTVVKGTHIDTGKPVLNTLANMQISVKYGTITKHLDFLPSPTVDGQYLGSIVPTRAGTYSLVMNGTIESQPINAEIPLDEVASIDTLSFPQTSSSGSGNAAINSQLGTIINQLTSDIIDAKNSVNTAAQNYEAASKSFQDVKDSTERLYMISMTGIGIGIAGVVIAVIAITRNRQ